VYEWGGIAVNQGGVLRKADSDETESVGSANMSRRPTQSTLEAEVKIPKLMQRYVGPRRRKNRRSEWCVPELWPGEWMGREEISGRLITEGFVLVDGVPAVPESEERLISIRF